MGGIPLDTAAIMSTVLEGILYGEYCNDLIRPMATIARFFRLFSAHVYRHHLVIDPQTSHARCQSPHRCCGNPAVDTEYYG
jgi:hypothetical protein